MERICLEFEVETYEQETQEPAQEITLIVELNEQGQSRFTTPEDPRKTMAQISPGDWIIASRVGRARVKSVKPVDL